MRYDSITRHFLSYSKIITCLPHFQADEMLESVMLKKKKGGVVGGEEKKKKKAALSRKTSLSALVL